MPPKQGVDVGYEKQVWKNLPEKSTPTNAERLNHMETQYDEAVRDTVDAAAAAILARNQIILLEDSANKSATDSANSALESSQSAVASGQFRDQSALSATAAEDAKLAAQAVPTTNDTVMAAVAANPASAFSTQLSATIVSVGSNRPKLGEGVFAAVDAALVSGRSAAIQVQGDSTGNASDEWVYGLADWLGDRHPTAHVKIKTWGDTAQAYGAWEVLQAGSGERHMISSASVRTMYAKPATIPYVTGDLDIRIRIAADDWTPAGTQSIVARNGAAGSRSWYFQLGPDGKMSFIWSNDGTAIIQKTTTAPLGFADGTERWFRATLDLDNTLGGYTWKGYTSTDGVTWTEVGSSVTTTGGPTTVFNPPAQEYEIGGRGMLASFTGKVYEVQIRDGIDGKIVNPQPIDSWTPRSESGGYAVPQFGGSPTVYVLNGSHPGAACTYLADATRHPKMVHPYAGSLIFQSCSHNDADNVDNSYIAARDAWQALTDARAVGSQTVIVTQNPQVSPAEATSIANHARRRPLLMAWAARKGLAVVDTYKRFLDHPGGAASLIAGDGVHPTPIAGAAVTGEKVWLDAITEAWDAVP